MTFVRWMLMMMVMVAFGRGGWCLLACDDRLQEQSFVFNHR